jgi:four helix bundle protein
MSFEKLKVYAAARALRAEVDLLRTTLNPRFEYLFRHLDEAVDSIMNNLAEGAESIYVGNRRLFYDHAANSAREARTGLRSIEERKGFGKQSAKRAIILSLAVSKMIAALIAALPAQ